MGAVEIARLGGVKIKSCLSFSRRIFSEKKIGLKNVIAA